MPKVDYAVADQGGFEPIPDGSYDAVLSAWDLKQGGKGPYYNLEFRLDGGTYNGRKIWMISSISDGALWRFKRDMLRLGAMPADMAPGSDVDTDDVVAGCVGAECRLVLKQEDYTKKDGSPGRRSVVDEILAATVRV